MERLTVLSPQKSYKSALFANTSQVAVALEKVYPVKKLWNVSEMDQARLLKFRIWHERYGIPYEYILEVLLTYYYSALPKMQRLKAKQSRGLGVRIATLVGNVSEVVLLEAVQQDFEGSNIEAWKEEEKERIEHILEPDVLPAKPRNVLQFPTLTAFVKTYTRTISVRKIRNDRRERKMKKMAWRGNPWR